VAPPLDQTRVGTLIDGLRFLYEGPNAIQRDVVPGAIEPRRIALIRGTVVSVSGSPLPGVKVTIVGGAQFGSTVSRVDGRFDIVLNGGGTARLRFERSGYLPAERSIALRWEQQRTLDAVFLVRYDEQATTIVSGSPNAQVARGSVSTDADGTRRATLIFLPQTTAQLVFSDGHTQSMADIRVRATEYSVGPNGPDAMPAPLPPQTAYTYCVDLTADEAVASGSSSVQFSSAVMVYVRRYGRLRLYWRCWSGDGGAARIPDSSRNSTGWDRLRRCWQSD
jgi:hypothetical protein